MAQGHIATNHHPQGVRMPQYTPEPGTLAHAREDLAAFVAHEQASGAAEADPYGYAITLVRVALEFALDDGISGAMSAAEYATVSALASNLATYDPASAPMGVTPDTPAEA